MKSFRYVIQDELGIHARPACLLVKEAKGYGSKISIRRGEQSVDAKKLLMVMSLAVKKGHEIIVTIDGEDEEEAFLKLQLFFQENL